MGWENVASSSNQVTVIVSTTNKRVHISFYGTTIGFARECINSGMDYWNGGMEFFKVQYHFLHPNKYISSPYVSK